MIVNILTNSSIETINLLIKFNSTKYFFSNRIAKWIKRENSIGSKGHLSSGQVSSYFSRHI